MSALRQHEVIPGSALTTVDAAGLVAEAADFTVTDCRAVLLHVVEELVQHLGHLEITRDVLAAGR